VLLARMGLAAAARVRDGYTERDVMGAVQRLYTELLPAGHVLRAAARQT